jgi:hypothetical protein
VTPLIGVWEVLHSVPSGCAHAPKAAECASLVVGCLGAATQPSAADEGAGRSAWTLTAAEVVSRAALRPNTAQPGLELLARLLPPAPPVCGSSLGGTERLLALQRLWAAHLQPLATSLQQLVALIGTTNVAPLAARLLHVCLRLAALAPPLALVVAQAALDPLLAALNADVNKVIGLDYFNSGLSF